MNTISDEYRATNKEMHATIPEYGSHGHRHSDILKLVAEHVNTDRILDYGCGKGTLAKNMPEYNVSEYDPSIEGKDSTPYPERLVYCGDVAEHVEHEYLDAFLDDLKRVTLGILVLVVATRPAKKNLPDGRNAHLIQMPLEWWLPRLTSRFDMQSVKANSGEFMFIGNAK
jgi:hypothetical protein